MPFGDSWTRADDERVARLVDALTADASRLEPRSSAKHGGRHDFARALVPVDDSPATEHALSWARFLFKTLRTQVTFAHVEEPASLREAFASRSYSPEGHHRTAQEILSRAVNEFGGISRGVRSELGRGLIIPRLLKADEKARADLTIVGSKSAGPWSRLLLGSVADALKNESKHDVLIAKNNAPPRAILVATDGSTPSKTAAEAAIRLARAWKVPIHVLYVLPSPGRRSARLDVFDETFQESSWPTAKELGMTFEVRAGRPAEEIVKVARVRRSGVIVMGSRGLSGLKSWVPGGVSNRVAHASPTSVLVVK